MLLPLLLLLLLTHPPPATPHFSAALSEWRSGHATYYAAADPSDAVAGACGYDDLKKAGYGLATAALSPSLFDHGRICGACFEVRCVDDLRWCVPGTSIVVTVTNYCAPNLGFSAENGGKCNPPNAHFVLPIEAFEKIAIWKAGNMPIQFRRCYPPNAHFVLPIEAFEKITTWKAGNMPIQFCRIKCRKEGGVRYTIDGSGIFISVLISNVAGAGDVTEVKIKGSRTGWLPMGRNWGQNWHINADLKNQPLSFEVTSSDGVTLTSYTVAPKDWNFGQTFEGKQFES